MYCPLTRGFEIYIVIVVGSSSVALCVQGGRQCVQPLVVRRPADLVSYLVGD